MHNKLDPFSVLPKFVSLHVLSYLHPVELAQCCQVNKKWKALATHDLLWKPLLDVYRSNNIDTKGLRVWSLIIPNNDFLLEKIKTLCKNIQLNQKITFTCFSLHDAKPLINISLSCIDNKSHREQEIINIACIFLPAIRIRVKQYSEWANQKRYADWQISDLYIGWREPYFLSHINCTVNGDLIKPNSYSRWVQKLSRKSISFNDDLTYDWYFVSEYVIYHTYAAIEERMKEMYSERKKKEEMQCCILY